jgi:hypothetical protein
MPERETIDTVLNVFLRAQRLRLSDRTYRNYEDVIRLLRHSLDGYGYTSLSDADARRWKAAFDAGDEEAFCHLFRPEKIPGQLSEFLGYFMVRKVMAGQELLKAAGTVTGKLVRWLRRRRISSRRRPASPWSARGTAHGTSRPLTDSGVCFTMSPPTRLTSMSMTSTMRTGSRIS